MTKAPNPFLVTALLVSILVHLFLVDRMVDLTIKWGLFSTAPADQLFQVRDLGVQRMPEVLAGVPQWRPEDLIRLGPAAPETAVEGVDADRELLIESEKFISTDVTEEKLLESIEKAIEAEEISREPEALATPAAEETIAQEVIAIDEALVKEEIPPFRTRISAKIERGTATADMIFFTDRGPSADLGPRAIGKRGTGEATPPRTGKEKEEAVKKALTEGTRTIPAVIAPPPTVVEREIESADLVDIVTVDYAKIRRYPALDDLLTVRLFTYHRPGERTGYFELVVEPRKDKRDFRIIPKDIVFVVDSSKSITQAKLNAYVEGLKLCLRALNPQDRFNIVEFKNFTRKFSEQEVVPVTPETISKAEAFLSGLVSEGSTGVYESMTEVVRAMPAPGRPRIIFLVSDGRPTTTIRENRRIINEVTRLNDLKASIFTFAGGEKINTSLLDLLSYRNKGARMFEPDDRKIAQSLLNFYQGFNSPILLNLRFNFGAFGSSEVYPKVLPDLYLHSGLEIFGRFAGEEEFSMQLLGEADGQTKEYVLQRKLTGRDSGDERVAQGWAFRKIYDLVGQMVQEGESQEFLSEIQRLSTDYRVETSYYVAERGRS